MTFIIGWKWNNVGYICADSAITGPADYASYGYTTFGELNELSKNYSVQEVALKIVKLDHIAIAYTGGVDPALSCIRTIKNNIDNGFDASESFEKAINSHTPLGKDAEYKLIAVCSESSHVKLFTFNMNNDQKIIEIEDGIVFAGSMPYANASQVAKQIGIITSISHNNPQNILVLALSVLQNIGIHEYLMKHGVGGVFSGIYTTNNKVYHQPSIMFCIVKDEKIADMVLVGFYNKALATSSTINKLNKIFSDEVNVNSEYLEKSDIREKIKMTYDAGKFDYIVLLGQQHKSVVVFEMRKSLGVKSCAVVPKRLESGYLELNVGASQQAVDYVFGKQKIDSCNILGTYVYFFEYAPK